MKRVIIADVRSCASAGTIKGHGYAVASNYLQIFRGAAEIKVAGGPAYAGKFGENCESLPYDVKETTPDWINKLRVLLNLKCLFRVCQQDTIVLQSSGVVTALVGIALFKKAHTRVYMILYNAEVQESWIKRLIFKMVKGKISGVICPNDEVGKVHGLPYCTVPDYIYCREQDGENTGNPVSYADKKYDFCMVGLIWRDKGMVEAARYFAGTPYKVLIAGSLSGEEGLEEELKNACSGADNIELRIGYLSSDEYEAAIRASRYSILNYSGAYSQHSSGVVFDMLFRGVPVIGRRCKTLKFIDDFQLGCTYTRIYEFAPESVMQESVYDSFCKRIEEYYTVHQSYRERLRNFIMQ